MMDKGEVFEGPVQQINRGGIVVDCWGVNGFIPNSMMYVPGKSAKRGGAAAQFEAGEPIRAVFVTIDKPERRLILSQKAVVQSERIKDLSVGQQVEARVTWIMGYGAFVDILLPDGSTADGLIHISELSWSRITTPESVVSVGEIVKCLVKDIEPAGRVNLSLKALKPDPLKQNMASLAVESEVEWREPTVTIMKLKELVKELQFEDNITEVKLGRQANVTGAVSQDLEIWLTKEVVDGHYNVMARDGGILQEVEVYCSLDQATLRQTIDRVLTRF